MVSAVNRIANANPVENAIKSVLDQHAEAIVIYSDVIDGEVNFGVATKLEKHKSSLSNYLTCLLAKLNEKSGRRQSLAENYT